MRLVICFAAYFIGIAAMVAGGMAGARLALKPEGEVAVAEPASRKPVPAPKTESAEAALTDAEWVPVWIAPTPKYPDTASDLDNAGRAKALAKERAAQRRKLAPSDWRLQERRQQLDGASSAYGYAPVARPTSTTIPDTMRSRDRPEGPP